MQEAIKIIANKLESEGKLLNLAPNSILEALSVDSSSEHFNSIAKELATRVNNELILVKNKIRPFMQEVIEETKKLVDNSPLESVIDKFNIKEYGYPDVLSELGNILHEPRVSSSLGNVRASFDVPEKERIKEYFLHTNASINAYFSPILNAASLEDLEAIWSKYLTNISDTNTAITELSYKHMYLVNDIILLFLAVDRLSQDDSLEDKEKEAVGLFYNELTNYLSLIKQTYDSYRSMERLVIKIEDGIVEVDSVIYKKYLEEGHVQEALLGMAVNKVKDVNNYLLVNIIAKENEYREAWSNFIKLSEYTIAQANVNRHQTAYDIIFDKIYREDWCPADIKEFLEANFEVANQKFRKFLQEEPIASILCVEHSIREIFGVILFPTTNFKRFADGISQYSKLNPNCTPADAATFAALEFFLDYMLEQISVGSMNGIPTV